MNEDFINADSFNEDDIVPYEFAYTEQQGFSVISIIGLVFISVLFSKLFPRLIGEVIIPFFLHSESELFQKNGYPIISEISLLFIPCFSLKFYDSQNEIFVIGNSVPRNYKIAFSFIICFGTMSISLISNDICLKSAVGDVDDLFDFVLYLFIDCILPSFCEEFVFRGWTFYYLSQKMNRFVAIGITSLLFTLFHPFQSWFSYLLMFLISSCWNYANIAADSIIISILSHFFHNFSQTLLLAIFPCVCNISLCISFIFWLVSSCMLFILFHKVKVPNETESNENYEANPEEIAFLR